MKTPRQWVGHFDLNWTSDVARQLDEGAIVLRRGQRVAAGPTTEGIWVGISKSGVKHVVWCTGTEEDTRERFEAACETFDKRGGRENSFY